MKHLKPLHLVTAMAVLWTMAFAVHIGCDSTGGLTQVPGLSGTPDQTVKVTAFLAKEPMFFAPDSETQRTNIVDVSSQIPAGAQAAKFGINAESLDLAVESIPQKGVNSFTIELAVGGEGAGEQVPVGSYSWEIDEEGQIVPTTVEAPQVYADVIGDLLGGPSRIKVVVRGDFKGEITIDQADIEIFLQPIGGPNSNLNVGDNANGNTGGNTNDNTGDNSNGNTGGNTNDNTGGNTNDNTDDNGNDNAGGNTNDNTDDNGNDNTGGNTNDNTDDNGNDNTGGNTNDNGNDNTGDNTNGNDNTDDNTNDNTGDNTNGNDNTSDGLCADGSIQLRTRIEGPGDFEVEVEYRENGVDCRRFRVDIEGFPAGSHDIFANGEFVGQIHADSEDGEGRLRLESEDGNFPADFPFLIDGDVVSVGSTDVTMQIHCSEIWSCANANGNDNTGGNTNGNDNTGGNTNGNDNTGDNTNMNG